MRLNGGKIVLVLLLCISATFSMVRNVNDFLIIGKWIGVYVCLVMLSFYLFINKILFVKEHNDYIDRKIIFTSMLLINTLTVLYCFAQLIDILPSTTIFHATADFDNPAGVATLLVISYAFLSSLFNDPKKNCLLMITFYCIDSLILFFIQSRVGVIGMFVSFFVYILFNKNLFTVKTKRVLLLLVAGLFLVSVFFLFSQKEASTNGRFIIWNCSIKMFLDAPIFGHGLNGFSESYMIYQSKYLQNINSPELLMLTDNINHPLSEFILVAVNFGCVGLVFLCMIIIIGITICYRSKSENKVLVLMNIAGICSLSLFSYPFRYPITLLSIVISFLLFTNKDSQRPKVIYYIFLAGCLISLFFMLPWINAQMKWKIESDMLGDNMLYRSAIDNYKSIEPILDYNAYFLYSMSVAYYNSEQFSESLKVAKKSSDKMANYNTELLIGDIYKQLGQYEDADCHYLMANRMCPSKIMPLYCRFNLYKQLNDSNKMRSVGEQIIMKPIKINTPELRKIRFEVKKELMHL